MKKKMALALILILVLVLGGCGKSSEDTKGSSETTEKEAAPTVAPDTVVSEFGDWSKYVTMGVYHDLVLEKVEYMVTDANVEDEIAYRLEETATKEQIKEGTVKDGDTVNIDYEGKMDGVAFEGGTAKGADLTIGSNSFIDGFEDGLIGVEVGATVDLNLTFPDPYPNNPDMAGKPTVFTVTVNYINGEDIVPELTDEWVTANSEEGSTTVDAYREEIRKYLEEESAQQTQSELEMQINDALLIIGDISEYPQELIDLYSNQVDSNISYYATMYGMEKADFISTYYGMTEEEYQAELLKIAQETAAQRMIYETIARLEGITFTQADVDAKGLEIATQYGYESVDAFKAEQGEEVTEGFKEELLAEKVIECVMSFADIRVVDQKELDTSGGIEITTEETSAEETDAENAE